MTVIMCVVQTIPMCIVKYTV
uniref:Uncharacterized protein n=1 Tax=Anguilla anguilla TaxID=7936 RepID=A0A0E9QGC6_ANGAN